MLMQLEQGTLSEEEEKAWLDYASSMFSSFLAVHILSEQNTILSQDAQQAAAYFRTGNFYKEVSAAGLYACAQLLKGEDPMACYLLTKEAFEKDPNLGYTLGTEYRYEGDSGEENLTKACPICGSREVSPYYCSPQSAKGKPAAGFPPGKLWKKCSECDNYYTYDFPLRRVGEINGHYTKNQGNQVLQARIPLHIYNDIFSKLRDLAK